MTWGVGIESQSPVFISRQRENRSKQEGKSQLLGIISFSGFGNKERGEGNDRNRAECGVCSHPNYGVKNRMRLKEEEGAGGEYMVEWSVVFEENNKDAEERNAFCVCVCVCLSLSLSLSLVSCEEGKIKPKSKTDPSC